MIPDYWTDLKVAVQDSPMVIEIPKSFFGEVKAVDTVLCRANAPREERPW